MNLSRDYLAGFFDAEGNLGVYKNGSRYYLTASLSQADSFLSRELFYSLKDNFGGSVSSSYRNTKPLLSYTIQGERAYILLGFLKDSTIIKRKQIELGLPWMDNQDGDPPLAIKDLKRNSIAYDDSLLLETKPSLAYLAGFFDGDGYVSVTRQSSSKNSAQLTCSLGQMSLDASCRLFNSLKADFGGFIRARPKGNSIIIEYILNSDNAYVFLSCIKDLVIFKSEQFRVALDWFESKPESNSRWSISEDEASANLLAINKLHELKRQSA